MRPWDVILAIVIKSVCTLFYLMLCLSKITCIDENLLKKDTSEAKKVSTA